MIERAGELPDDVDQLKTLALAASARDDRPFGGAAPPMVAYRFEDCRSGDLAARRLGDFRGSLRCDGYSGYRKLESKVKVRSSAAPAK